MTHGHETYVERDSWRDYILVCIIACRVNQPSNTSSSLRVASRVVYPYGLEFVGVQSVKLQRSSACPCLSYPCPASP